VLTVYYYSTIFLAQPVLPALD